MKRIRKHFIFYGEVQGVGFRFTAYHAAQRSGITGWVRNLYDGSVEAEAEGTEADIDRMIQDIKSARFIYIESMEVTEIPTQGDSSFHIR